MTLFDLPSTDPEIRRGAVLSDDGRYRYLLWREWAARGALVADGWEPRRWPGAPACFGVHERVAGACVRHRPGDARRDLVWLMLNPSTADAAFDDQTVRRIVEYSRRDGASRAVAINLFAYRATEPWDLLRTDADIVGPGNDPAIRQITAPRGPHRTRVVCAWSGWRPSVAAYRQMLAGRIADVTAILEANECELLCLGRTASGAPRHPSRGEYRDLVPYR